MGRRTKERRDGFQSRWGFILACIGSAVGMANIWRFPWMVSKYGGLTFLLPYFLFVILIGSTGVIEEFALGRAAGAGPVGAFSMCTEKRSGNRRLGEGIGALPVLGSMGLAIGYSVVMGWIFKYAFMAITGDLFAMGQDMNVIGGTFGQAAPEATSLIESISWVTQGVGNNLWIVVAVAVSLIIMSMGVSGGIEKACKVMMPVLFLLFLALGIYIAFLPGAADGYKYIFTLDPAGLKSLEVWIYAFGQAFFSLSVAGNGSVIYGSYLKKDVAIPGSARNVAVFDTVASMLAACVILPAMATTGAAPSQGGPGLMFVYLVPVINGMAGGRIVGLVFFFAVLFAGLSSIINMYEAPTAFLQEKFHMKRTKAVCITHAAGVVIAILIQCYASQWMDIVSIYICPFGALLAGIMFFWVLKKEDALSAVNEGSAKPIGGWFYPLGKYVYCIAALVALIAGAKLGGIG